MRLFTKILKANPQRKSRFHTDSGTFCGARAFLSAPRALATWMIWKVAGRWVVQPWWVYSATRFVDRNLRPTDRVLEFGSGFSTLWLAARCDAVLAVEGAIEWSTRVTDRAHQLALRNVRVVQDEPLSAFARLRENPWDVVVIDSKDSRREIMREVLSQSENLQPRVIVFDDTDKPENIDGIPRALRGWKARVFRGFKPQTLHACETTVLVRQGGEGHSS